jgi:hypothetical protein
MIISKLMGGLGNQMFQYAFGKHLAIKHNSVLKLDTSFLLDRTPRKTKPTFREYDLSIFHISADFASKEEVDQLTRRSKFNRIDKIQSKLLGPKRSYYIEPGFRFFESCLNIPDNSYVQGYWQSEKYFKSVSTDLRKMDFTFKEPLLDISLQLMEKIKQTNAVCIHIRRGDFLNNPFHGTMGQGYYSKGEELIKSKIKDPVFYVFSDEIEWCRIHLKFQGPVTFVSDNYTGNKCQDYLRLMAGCKHFIISNSSFAWWAVWLSGQKNNMVIAPIKWYSDPSITAEDLVQPDWIRL